MSFFSRLFRKAPSLSPVSTSAPQRASSKKADKALPSAADRALADAAEEGALQSAIDSRDAQAVARLVVAGTSTKLRQAAAQAIEDPDVLRQLIRDVRGGNDKAVYKILTSKRDVLLEQARKLEQLQAEIDATSAALERHSRRSYDALYSQRLDQFERHWEVVAEQADPELRGRVQQWISISRETVAEQLRQVAAQAAKALAVSNAAAEQRLRQEQVQEAPAAVVAEPEQIIEEPKPELTEQQQAEKQAIREISEMIRKARAALSGGSTARAAGMRQAIEEKLAAAPTLPTNLVSQMQLLDQKLEELKDWKRFSVAPKRTELIEEMELLVEATLDPLALADRIKSLKDEWRTLNKGAGENLDAESQRFQEAAKKAYQPCAEYFAAQALIQKENLQRRDALLAKLTAFEAEYNWEQADWRAVINILRETKEEWRHCVPVDRRASKQQQDGFVAITGSLQGRVDAEHARNQKQKESLVERSKSLLASDDVRKAIDAIKKLQQEWQTVGPVPREVDQRLWVEFRQHCDAIFQKRQQEFASYTAGLENNKTQAVALCEQIEKIAALEGPELTEGARALAQLRSDFAALGEFPRAESQALRSRFDRGLDRCEASIVRQHARDAERSWNDLFEAANHVRAYRLAVALSLDTQQLDTLKAAAETFIASVQKWPKSGLNAIKQGLAAERSADLAANETALKLLCIRAEMQTDMPTPPEDQALRREYQLQRLVQNLGQGAKADATQLDTMVIEWIAVGPIEEATYQSLVQRFLRCRNRV